MEPWKLTLSCTGGLWMVTGGYRRLPGGSAHFSWQTDKHFIIIYISSSSPHRALSALAVFPPTRCPGRPKLRGRLGNKQKLQLKFFLWIHLKWHRQERLCHDLIPARFQEVAGDSTWWCWRGSRSGLPASSNVRSPFLFPLSLLVGILKGSTLQPWHNLLINAISILLVDHYLATMMLEAPESFQNCFSPS